MQKKPYAAPTLVRYGSVEEETRGPCGSSFEVYGARLGSDDGKLGGTLLVGVLTPASSQK